MRKFDRACKQEMDKALVHAITRMVIPIGKKTPPPYKLKLPRFSRTIVD